MMNEIRGFSGEYRFLSNFWPCSLTFGSWAFTSAEYAYQAAKSNDPEEWRAIQACSTPGQAKRLGKKLTLRPDWEKVKLECMHEILTAKFSIPELKDMLLATGTAQLVEENHWGDRYWGVCQGTGHNHLGRLLMQVRDEIGGAQ